jgi:hypothetical protein
LKAWVSKNICQNREILGVLKILLFPEPCASYLKFVGWGFRSSVASLRAQCASLCARPCAFPSAACSLRGRMSVRQFPPRNLGNPFQKGVSEEEEGKAENRCRNVKIGLKPAVVSRADAYPLHRSHFGSRYKLGCCGPAGLFYARLGSNPPVHKLVI